MPPAATVSHSRQPRDSRCAAACKLLLSRPPLPSPSSPQRRPSHWESQSEATASCLLPQPQCAYERRDAFACSSPPDVPCTTWLSDGPLRPRTAQRRPSSLLAPFIGKPTRACAFASLQRRRASLHGLAQSKAGTRAAATRGLSSKSSPWAELLPLRRRSASACACRLGAPRTRRALSLLLTLADA